MPLGTPLRWPNAWKDPSALGLLKGTAIDHLVIEQGAEWDAVRSAADKAGLQTFAADSLPAGVSVIKGEWPGVKMMRGGRGAAMGGPTGVPWVDSNGWNIRLSAIMHPHNAIWVDAAPPADTRLAGGSYLTAIADSSAYGGRWIITLDDALAEGMAAAKPASLATWKTITSAVGFFAAHKAWAEYDTVGVAGVVSDFTGQNEFFGHELLNLLARAGVHYQIWTKDSVANPLRSSVPFESLRAVIYADAEPPTAEVRKQILAFVQRGGLLITVPQWGDAPGTPAKGEPHPRYGIREFGKGRIAMAHEPPGDPYEMANDAAELISHRYDLVRFWNGGATGSYYTEGPEGKIAVAHLLFYSNRGPDAASVRIAGPWRRARACTVDVPSVPGVEVQLQKEALEIHLPRVPQYVALELSGG